MRKIGLICLLGLAIAAPASAQFFDPTPGPAAVAVNTTHEGSILVWPHVQISWLPTAGGGETIFTDTIITLVNNSQVGVRVKFLIWNGDCQIPDFGTGAAGAIERGCNFIDRSLSLTPFEPLYWSAFTGTKRNPLGSADAAPGPGVFVHTNTSISFRGLDSDGRPDTELDPTGAIGIRRIRGFLVAIATSQGPAPVIGNPICHDHLSGTATVINYSRTSAFQYKAYAYDCVTAPAPLPLGQLQVLNFDNAEYEANWEKLLARFFAFNEPAPVVPPGSPTVGPSAAYARNLAVTPNLRNTEINGRLSLLPVVIDAANPSGNLNSQFRTEVVYDIFNENETGFTGTQKCICCWDSALFENYAEGAHPGAPFPFSAPENFRATILGTDFGFALIDAPGPAALGFDNCRRLPVTNGAGISDPGSNPSVAAPLLGIETTVSRWGSESFSEDGAELTGVGVADLTGLLTYRVTSAQNQDEGQVGGNDVPAVEVTKKSKKK